MESDTWIQISCSQDSLLCILPSKGHQLHSVHDKKINKFAHVQETNYFRAGLISLLEKLARESAFHSEATRMFKRPTCPLNAAKYGIRNFVFWTVKL